jgi:zinc protease
MQIERSGHDNARTRPGTLSSRPSLRFQAAARLSPDVPIEALDPVGFPTVVLLLKPVKLRKIFCRGQILRQLYRAHGQIDGDLAGLRALMPRSGFRLTGLKAASKLFFPSSQTSVRVLGLFEMGTSEFSRMAQISTKISMFAGFAVLVLLLTIPVAHVRAQTVGSPERGQLLNGLTILYGDRAGEPNVVLKLRIKSGAVFDLAGKAGTMSLLADAMFPESTTREYVTEQLGGQLDVSTSFDSIDVTISGKSTELERMIELLRNAILNVNLSTESVAALKEARIKELSESQSTPAAVADMAISSRLFGTYPYGHPPDGTIESMGRIERADLMLARDRFLHADNATLVVIGGVEKARVMRALRQLLGPWQKSDRIVPATFRQPGAVDDRVLLIDQPKASNVQIRLAVRSLSRSDPDSMAEFLLAHLANERWRAAVPEISTTSYVRAEPHALSGMFTFAAIVPASSSAKTIAAARKVMSELTEAAPSQGEMPGLVSLSRLPEALSTANSWLDAETYKLPSGAANDASRIRPEDLRRVAVRLFANSAPLAIVVLGNASELQAQLGLKIELRASTPDAKPAPTPASPTNVLPRKP